MSSHARPAFCALCTADIAVGDPVHMLDGYVICPSCDEGAPDAREPEAQQRGYQPQGGIGVAFQRQVTKVHDELVPQEVVRMECEPHVTKRSDQLPHHEPLSKNQWQYRYGNKSRHRHNRRSKKT